MATKLFISFSGLLVALKSGKIPLSDLDTALFYFGCTRDHAYNPSKHGVELDEVSRIFRNNPEEGVRVHQAIVEALKKAEKGKRVLYRKLQESNSYEQLNRLLKKNGFPPLKLSMLDPDNRYRYHYNYYTVLEAVQTQNIGVEVFWN